MFANRLPLRRKVFLCGCLAQLVDAMGAAVIGIK